MVLASALSARVPSTQHSTHQCNHCPGISSCHPFRIGLVTRLKTFREVIRAVSMLSSTTPGERTLARLSGRLLETTEVVQVLGPAGMRDGLEKAVSRCTLVHNEIGIAGTLPASHRKKNRQSLHWRDGG